MNIGHFIYFGIGALLGVAWLFAPEDVTGRIGPVKVGMALVFAVLWLPIIAFVIARDGVK